MRCISIYIKLFLLQLTRTNTNLLFEAIMKSFICVLVLTLLGVIFGQEEVQKLNQSQEIINYARTSQDGLIKEHTTTCDPTQTPLMSCHDCNTRLICKPLKGILFPCRGNKPYCKYGLCSSTPSDECVS